MVDNRIFWCLIWYLNKTWKPTRWRSWQSNLKTYQRRRDNVTLRRGGDVTQQRYWVFHLGLTGDTYIPLRRLSDVPMRGRWVFHLRFVSDVVKTHWWDVVVTSFWDLVTTFQEDVVETYHWDALCFIWDVPATSLERTERRRYDVTMTSCCRVGRNCQFLLQLPIYVLNCHVLCLKFLKPLYPPNQ